MILRKAINMLVINLLPKYIIKRDALAALKRLSLTMKYNLILYAFMFWAATFHAQGAESDANPCAPLRVNAFAEACRSIDLLTTQINRGAGADQHIQRAVIWHRIGAYRRAIADYDQALIYSPQDWTIYGSRAQAWYHIFINERAIADFDEAIRLFNVRSNSSDNTNYIILSSLYYQRAMAWEASLPSSARARAMNDLNEALRIDPRNHFALYARGNLFLSSGDQARASSDYEQALQINPNFAPAHYMRGRDHEDAGDLALALTHLRSAVRLDPEHTPAQRALIRVERKIDALDAARRHRGAPN